MLRFANVLKSVYHGQSAVSFISPPVFIAGLPGLSGIAKKYLAYIDKLIIFPLYLMFASGSYDSIHIADHSNAFYTFFCPRGRCLVTCHDLLAVRGAHGDPSAFCRASPIGVWLQRLIVSGLRRADAVTFVSYATYADFKALVGSSPNQRVAVIPSPLNAPFSPDPNAFILSSEEEGKVPNPPYLLMVGSALPRKNRGLALQLLKYLGPNSPYRIVFSGAPLNQAERHFQRTHPLGGKLISVPNPSHGLLNQLYCHAHALLFPSFAEGFGWPLVEAQVCRCPVIASTTTSIPEVAGEGALYADPQDVAGFAAHVLSLEDSSKRERLISIGEANTLRYALGAVREAYQTFAFPNQE